MELGNNEKKYNRKIKKGINVSVYLFIYLQLINIITGPDIVLKFLGYKYNDVNEIGLGWFTTSVNVVFILISALILLNNKHKSLYLFSRVKKLLFLLLLTFFSGFLVSENMFEESISIMILTFGSIIKVCSLIVLFHKYQIQFLTTLLRSLKALILIMLLYLILFFANGFSTTLIGRYQSLFAQPNTLGQFSSLVIVALFADKLFFNKNVRKVSHNFFFFFYLLIAIIFVVMSQSFTNFLLLVLILFLYFFYSIRLNLLRVLLLTSTAIFTYFFYTNSKDLSFLSFSKSEVISLNFNRDLTLTGRTQIWRDVFDRVQYENKELFGYGIGGFWGKTGSPSSKIDNPLFAEIGQSHNGLIDLYAQFGLIGIFLFLCFFFYIISKLSELNAGSPHVIFFYFFLVFFIFNNLVESSYLQPKNFLNTFFIFLIFYVLEFRNKNNISAI